MSRTYCANELDFDACVLEPLAIFWSNRHGALHALAIGVQWGLLNSVLVELDIDGWPVVAFFENYVDVHRRREEVRHGDVTTNAL